jgi:hypothetical protein
MIEERRYSTGISMSFVRTSLAVAGYCQVPGTPYVGRLCQRTRGSWELENVRVRRDKSLVNFSRTICFCAHALHNIRVADLQCCHDGSRYGLQRASLASVLLVQWIVCFDQQKEN